MSKIEMGLVDWFAGQALAGLLATNEDFRDDDVGDGWKWHAAAAYNMAEAMLAERGRRTDELAAD